MGKRAATFDDEPVQAWWSSVYCPGGWGGHSGFPPSEDELCDVDVTADAGNKLKGQGCSGTDLSSLDMSTECPKTESDQARRRKVWMLQGNSTSILS